ncbi:LysM peptidoglycan-binding domain-containing protein [Pseudalkalibacillus caeni]|nr:LysM peptidoglycan-binding domain-containing protein [Pseudalkalibacillus caeni]
MRTLRQRVYTVRPGDSLYKIANRFQTTIESIKHVNSIPSNVIYVGQQLTIPQDNDRSSYTVMQGDNLYLIAQQLGTSVQNLKEANRLDSNVIYIGQQLRLPDDYRTTYTVQPGDSLFQLAQKFGTTVESFMQLNNLTSTDLSVGQKLEVPLYTEVIVKVDVANVRTGPGKGYNVITQLVKGAKLRVIGTRGDWYRVVLYDGTEAWIGSAVVNFKAYGEDALIASIIGYYTLQEGPSLPSSYQSFVNHTSQLSQLALFLFRIKQANPTEIEKFGEFTDQEIRTLVGIAHRNNIKAMPVVHNLLYKRGDTTINKQVVKEVVSSEQNRRAFALNLVELVEKYNFDGVDIDIEDVYIEDSERLSLLYQTIGEVFDEKGYFFSTSVPSRASDEPVNPFSDPFDYDVIGAAVDQFIVMLYNEFGWPGSPPGPAVTIGWMEKAISYAKTQMAAEKIVAAVSVFGFDFNLDTGKNTYVTYDMAIKIAEKYNADIQFSEERQTPFFKYTDEEGNNHEVWYEDERSIRSKIALADRLGIRGVALWRLGMEDPKIWEMIQNEVAVRRGESEV